MGSTRTERSAFTLIELLVVIAIITIVAAILFPVFAQVREKARQAQCLSNLRQIGQATLIYLEDYDGRFPGGPGRFGLAFPGPEGSWERMRTGCCGNRERISVAVQLRAYLKSTGVLVCPNDPTGARGIPERDARIMRQGYEWGYGISQGANYPEYPLLRGGRVTGQPILLAEITKPSLLFVFGDSFAEFHARYRPEEWRQNLGYADGHVKFTRLMDDWLPPKQRPWEWSINNPRRPVNVERPCIPTCVEEAARE